MPASPDHPQPCDHRGIARTVRYVLTEGVVQHAAKLVLEHLLELLLPPLG